MKRWISVFILIILVTGCVGNASFLPGTGESAGCFLCGMNAESLMSVYRGRNSLGILCTDRFSVVDVYAGKRSRWDLRSQNSGNSMRMVILGESRGYISVSGEHDRGISEISIELGEDDVLHTEGLKEKLCEACLEKFDQVQAESSGKSADVFLVDLKTAELYSLNESGRFYVGDYYVIVESGAERIEVVVAYAPA